MQTGNWEHRHLMNNMIMLNFEKSERITDTSYFVLQLSDGREIFQDFEPKIKQCWLRVQDFLQQNPNLAIVGMKLIARGRTFVLPSNQNGYFWGNKIIRVYPSKLQIDCVGIGYYDGNKVIVRWFSRNDFNKSIMEERSKSKAGFFLIENERHQ